MRFVNHEQRRYALFERLGREPGLAHAFSTRPDDLAARHDAGAPRRAERRAQMARDWRLDPQYLCPCIQVHGTELAVIDDAATARRLEGVDGVMTDLPNVPLMTFSADCPLVLLYDPLRNAVGMVHASWRCTVASATCNLVRAMVERYACRPENMLVGVGPSAGPCCYEVGPDVVAAAADLPGGEALFEKRNERVYFDLWRANRAQLIATGVCPKNVETAEICTLCAADLFYSFRREGAGCGHFGLMAGLRETDRAAS